MPGIFSCADATLIASRGSATSMSLSGTGTLSATYMGSAGGATTDLLFDVTGYFVP
jgi:hypothetical protein